MKKPVLISLLLIITMAASFLLPQPNYASLNILEDLKIPAKFPGWTSQDYRKELNLDDDRYNFIGDVFARIYQNRNGEMILFLILDAGNFHNPKVCYTSSGFTWKDLGSVDFTANTTTFPANALLMERQNTGMNMFYWLCIDKKIVSWTGQKIMELWSSLMNQKKAGFMVRLEIPAVGTTKDPEAALALGKDFIGALSKYLSQEQREYLFGK